MHNLWAIYPGLAELVATHAKSVPTKCTQLDQTCVPRRRTLWPQSSCLIGSHQLGPTDITQIDSTSRSIDLTYVVPHPTLLTILYFIIFYR